METPRTVWGFPLFTFSDGTTIILSQLILVAVVLGVG
jgi:hypothetical protein